VNFKPTKKLYLQPQASVILVIFIFIQGCSTINNFFGTKKTANENSEFFIGKENLDAAFRLLENGQFNEASEEFKKFINNNPSSPYWIQATFGLALVSEGLEEWDEALKYFREITHQAGVSGDHEVAAQSFYKMALCYEQLGNNEMALASLTDASNRSAYLPIEIARAELPARLGVLYTKLNQNEIAETYFHKAENGILWIKKLKTPLRDPNWLGKTLLKMGTVSLNQLSEETFMDSVNNLSRSQKYLLQAIEESDSQSSKSAEIELQNEYSTLTQFIEKLQTRESGDWQRALKDKTEKQFLMAAQLLEASENLKLFLLPDEHPNYKKTAAIPSFLDQVELKLAPFTYSQDLILPLTPEAEKLSSIKRQVRLLKLEQDVPKENERPAGVSTELPKKKKKKDPNL
jgi:tetratricopeptide (TPR) repeat protein